MSEDNAPKPIICTYSSKYLLVLKRKICSPHIETLVARALGIRPRQLVHPPESTLTRPVSLIGRPISLSLPVVQHFYQALRQNLKA